MLKFILFELKYWLRSPMLWIFLGIITLLVFGASSSDNISLGADSGNIKKNAPQVIQFYYGIMSLLCLLMTTAFMNATAIRDFQSGMYQFVFSSPIKKSDYFFGKYIGAVIIAVIPLLGVSIGSLLAPLAPWIDAERFGPVIISGHINGIISFAIPNIIISSVALYALALIFRNNIVSFVGAIVLLVIYSIAGGFARDIEKEWISALLDPFGFRPMQSIAKYMTVDEKNTSSVALSGYFLLNRLVWLIISLLGLGILYTRFKFTIQGKRQEKRTNKQKEKNESSLPIFSSVFPTAKYANKFSFPILWHLIKFETFSIIKHPTFIIILSIGLINLVTALTSFTDSYGTSTYPVTYKVIGTIKTAFYVFIISIITFYSGVLVWKERDVKINEIQDATPIPGNMLFLSKFIAIFFTLGLILLSTIFTGMIMQTILGYTRYELGVYLTSLIGLDLLAFTYLVVVALVFQYLINNRYIAYFAFVAFVIVNSFIWNALEINTYMVNYGQTPNITYSDMNGFGPFVEGQIWFHIYWSLFSLILCFVCYAYFIRGKENHFAARSRNALQILKRNFKLAGVLLLLFIICGGFVFYNTQILNTYKSGKVIEKLQVEYENKYKKYENIPQPRFIRINYKIDIFPNERNLKVNINAWIKNKTTEPISDILFNLPQEIKNYKIDIKNSKLKLNDIPLNFQIYTLSTPLAPGDSIEVNMTGERITKGFENEVEFTKLTQNGTFFNNRDICPSIGYSRDFEISDKQDRKKHNLPKRAKMAALNDNDMVNRRNTYISQDADWVKISTVISTVSNQTAIAPGSLIKQWESAGRRYFNYELEQKSLNFYSFISAEYQIAREKWQGIDLEVYYHKDHAYNVPNMLKSMRKSLEYYTQNFGKYYHKQCRIIEFPRYSSFAQAFPGTMPYSEGIGFIMDLRKVTEDDVDQVFYVVAHEMGHQYWAHQLIGPEMEGSEMMAETFAQYSALMVMEKEYGKNKMRKFLKYEMDGYLKGRSFELEAERPLMKVAGQPYIHYQKGSIVMYYLKEMIGEKQVNHALSSLIDSFAYKEPPYPTTIAAVNAFRDATPDSLQYIISDLFEHITVFSNRIIECHYTKKGNLYEVKLKTNSEKFRSDSLGKETPVPIKDYIDIGVFGETEGKNILGKPLIYKRVLINKKENDFIFTTNQKPYQVGINPYCYLIDRISDDNIKKISD